MPLEIERKFLVKHEEVDSLLRGIVGIRVEQGYLAEADNAIVRVRIYGDTAYLTIKSSTGQSHTVEEFEYEIPVGDCEELLKKCKYKISKTRYLIPSSGNLWEVDLFANGLVTAEFENESRELVENVVVPDWVLCEVTADKNYSNFSLAKAFYGG